MFPCPFRETNAPHVLVQTDIGYDLDDALALWIAARTVGHLTVITTDETRDYQRAHLARELLDRLGRRDVKVLAGHRPPGAEQRFLMDGLVGTTAPVCTDVVDYVVDACETSTQPVLWVGMGPVTDLDNILIDRPDLCEQIQLTMMGGWLDSYRRPDRASHNVRMDPHAFGLVMRLAHRPRLVMSTHTNHDALAITPASPLYQWLNQWLTMPEAPFDFELIAHNATRWFTHRTRRAPNAVPSSWMSDPVTLLAALDDSLVDFTTETVRIQRDGRLVRDADGRSLQVSTAIHYDDVLTRLSHVLPMTPVPAPPAPLSHSTHTTESAPDEKRAP